MAYSEFSFDSPLFHYTSIEAFKAIANSGQMRFSRADQTNDPFEVVFVRRSLLRHLDFILEKAKTDGDRSFWNHVRNSYEKVSDPRKFFLCCWSTRHDSIAMWRLYSQEGKGVVFGLRPRAFSGFDCRLSRIRYVDDEAAIPKLIQESASKAKDDFYSFETEPQGLALAVRLVEATLNTKRKEWDYENEVRLSFAFNEEKYASIKEEVDEQVFSRFQALEPTAAQSETERQYVFQEFGKRNSNGIDRSGAIAELILGPNCDWSVEEATQYLSGLGYENFRVKESKLLWR